MQKENLWKYAGILIRGIFTNKIVPSPIAAAHRKKDDKKLYHASLIKKSLMEKEQTTDENSLRHLIKQLAKVIICYFDI